MGMTHLKIVQKHDADKKTIILCELCVHLIGLLNANKFIKNARSTEFQNMLQHFG